MLRALTNADLQAALDALGTLSEAAQSDGQFARHGVATMRRLVASDLTTLSTCDLEAGHRSVVSDVPGAIAVTQIEAFDRHLHAHPLVRAHGCNPGARTQRLSDVVPASGFHRTPLYNDYYLPIRIEHVMAVPIHVHKREVVGFVLNRSGADFSERERARVEVIRPHLGNLFRLSREMAGARSAWGVPPVAAPPGDCCLTEREREVMGWLAGGKTDRDIADILGISRRTVHKHLQRIYDKLGVETRTAALARWMRCPPSSGQTKLSPS